jgi:hypothetical protein
MTKSVHKRLLGSLKNGCFSASFAVNRSDASNLSNPCNKSISKPPEWSTCCIIKFCTKSVLTIVITVHWRNGEELEPNLVVWWVHTFQWLSISEHKAIWLASSTQMPQKSLYLYAPLRRFPSSMDPFNPEVRGCMWSLIYTYANILDWKFSQTNWVLLCTCIEIQT